MGNVVSTLLMRMIDDVSGPARKIRAAMAGVDGDAKKFAARAGKPGGAAGRAGEAHGALGFMAAGGRYLATAAGGYLAGATGKEAYAAFADFDRKITRILITAEAGAEEAARTKRTITDIARETALPIGQVVEGLDSLVAAGRALPDAMAFLPSVARTAQAAGAEVVDIAKSADALGVSLKIPVDSMEEAFDRMAKAGKLGKFELKDMARSLPSLLPLAASKGFQGMEGLTQVVTYLQMIRQGTGTADEAADSFRDMLGKIASTETVNKFKKFGIDIKKELADVRKRGGNEFDAMFAEGGLLERALKKGAQVTDLFQDVQAYRGALAFRNALADKSKMMTEVADAAGTVTRDLARVTRDAAAASQRLGNAWTQTLTAFGNTADAAGVTSLLERIAANANDGASALERFVAALKEGNSVVEAIRIAGDMDKKTPDQIRARAERELTGGHELKDVGADGRTILGGAPAKAAVATSAEARRRAAKALKEAQRLATIASKYPDGRLPPILQAQRDAVDEELKQANVDAADQHLVDVSLGPGFDSRAEDTAHAGRMRDTSGLPMPRPKPEPLTIEATLQTKYDEAIAEARRAAAVIQQTFDGIAIRPRVEMPSIPNVSYEQGQRVQSMRDGSYSDNGGRR